MEVIKISKDNISHHVNKVHDAVNLYLKIYSAPPYNEKFEFDDIIKEFYNYIDSGLLLLAINKHTVIGFLATSYGSDCDEQLRLNLISNNIDPSSDVYFSEFGVDINYRCQGIGKLLLDFMLEYYKDKQIYLRTAKYNNDKIINYYLRAGFKITNVSELVSNKRMDGTIDIDERFYLVKN